MTEKQEQQVQTAIRLFPSLLARIDKLAAQMSLPGRPCTRTDAIRMAVHLGVERLEADKKKPQKKKEPSKNA